MSQSAFVLVLASALAGAATIALASATFTRKPTVRALWLVAIGTAITIAAYAVIMSGLRINFTPSMPTGIYRLAPVAPGAIRRGMLVAVCMPWEAAEVGRRRGYLSRGECNSDTEPLLKTVAAIGDDVVAVSTDGVSVNGRLLPNSRPLLEDSPGRRLTSWPRNCRLEPGLVWLYADHPRSWDSRYWGPVPIGDVLARAIPLLIVPSRAFYNAFYKRVSQTAYGVLW